MDTFDHIYWINLDYRGDRRIEMETWMKELGIPEEKQTRISAIYTPYRGHIGCLYSHIKALKTFLNSTHNKVLILEDDYMPLDPPTFLSNFQRLADSQLPYDLVMIAYNELKSEPLPQAEWLHKVSHSFTSSGYLLTRQFAPILLQNFEEAVENILTREAQTGRKADEFCLDVYWQRLMPISRWYCFYPRIGKQREGFSDIQGHYVNYKG